MSANMKAVLTSTANDTLTVDAVRAAMPKRQKHNITPALVDELNRLVVDPEAREGFRNNLISYTNVLQDPNVKLNVYIEAVKYVSYKLLGHTNQEAWMKVFPDRYQRLLDDEKDAVFIRATVSNYNKNKVVNKIMEQTLVPSWVLNHDMYQKALNVQVGLMCSADSEKVRTEAANSILVHLKQPEAVQMELKIDVKQDDSIRELREATLELAKAQRLNIEAGASTAADIAKSKLIDGECERLD